MKVKVFYSLSCSEERIPNIWISRHNWQESECSCNRKKVSVLSFRPPILFSSFRTGTLMDNTFILKERCKLFIEELCTRPAWTVALKWLLTEVNKCCDKEHIWVLLDEVKFKYPVQSSTIREVHVEKNFVLLRPP